MFSKTCAHVTHINNLVCNIISNIYIHTYIQYISSTPQYIQVSVLHSDYTHNILYDYSTYMIMKLHIYDYMITHKCVHIYDMLLLTYMII